MLGLHMERLSDIALADEDSSMQSGFGLGLPLQSRIELRDIRFRYHPSEPWILNGLDLTVEPGDHVAITGPSGGGKSTLLKVIVGLAEPESGEILVDGIPLRQFGYKNFHEQIAVVLQDDALFAGSLAENIALFDDAPDMRRIMSCAMASSIHDDIVRMPMGYDTLIGDMGSALSGGQKQRVLLARALYRRPKILVMDEGTAHLDSATEKKVNDAIQSLGITRIIVAHRAETLASATRTYVVQCGRLSRKGAHDPAPTYPGDEHLAAESASAHGRSGRLPEG
jgi:ATP-binding cassette subfamily B protein RaxB